MSYYICFVLGTGLGNLFWHRIVKREPIKEALTAAVIKTTVFAILWGLYLWGKS